ncbi:MAG: hypothetical protein RLZZ129_2425, partial [Verrucomicrobiota bacterium]
MSTPTPVVLPKMTLPAHTPAAPRLAACKDFLRTSDEVIRRRHKAGASGLEVVRARSAVIDELLRALFANALASYQQSDQALPAPVALVALGGYGRGELSPLSDVDVMFLFPAKTKPAVVKPLQEHLSNEILYPLWDCDLKVGHSTRNVDEVFIEARKDIQTKTALLESRLIAGSASLYENFASAYRSYFTAENPKSYIASRLEDQNQRRIKYGDTVFLQEPDIKNGVGGLRDYQNTLWMARVKLGITTMG